MKPRLLWGADEEEASPLTRARASARRLWHEFHRVLDRKYYLAATLRDNHRLTPEDTHRITSVMAEINEYLGDLDAKLDVAEAGVKKLTAESIQGGKHAEG